MTVKMDHLNVSCFVRTQLSSDLWVLLYHRRDSFILVYSIYWVNVWSEMSRLVRTFTVLLCERASISDFVVADAEIVKRQKRKTKQFHLLAAN